MNQYLQRTKAVISEQWQGHKHATQICSRSYQQTLTPQVMSLLNIQGIIDYRHKTRTSLEAGLNTLLTKWRNVSSTQAFIRRSSFHMIILPRMQLRSMLAQRCSTMAIKALSLAKLKRTKSSIWTMPKTNRRFIEERKLKTSKRQSSLLIMQ